MGNASYRWIKEWAICNYQVVYADWNIGDLNKNRNQSVALLMLM